MGQNPEKARKIKEFAVPKPHFLLGQTGTKWDKTAIFWSDCCFFQQLLFAILTILGVVGLLFLGRIVVFSAIFWDKMTLFWDKNGTEFWPFGTESVRTLQ